MGKVSEGWHRKKQAIKAAHGKKPKDAMESIRAYYERCLKHGAVYEGKVLYEARLGRGMEGNPFALFLELLNHMPGNCYQHIWSVRDEKTKRESEEEWKDAWNVTFVVRNTYAYAKALSECKYLINDEAFPSYFLKREAQVYINAWHGMEMAKRKGRPLEYGTSYANTVRNFLSADYLLSSSPLMTEAYRSFYQLDGLYEGTVLCEGMPWAHLARRARKPVVYRDLAEKGIGLDPEKKLLLFVAAESSESLYIQYAEGRLKSILEEQGYQVLTYQQGRTKGICLSELFSVTDVLVAEEESAFFGFLLMGKPLYFHVPPMWKEEEREEVKKLFGCLSYVSLERLLEDLMQTECAREKKEEAMRSQLREMLYREDGQAARRIMEEVIYGIMKEERHVKAGKKRLLFLLEEKEAKRRAASLLSVLQLLDEETYIAVIYIEGSEGEKALLKAGDMPKNVRILKWVPCGSWELRPFSQPFIIGESEYRRCFGDTRFDKVLTSRDYGTVMLPFKGGCPNRNAVEIIKRNGAPYLVLEKKQSVGGVKIEKMVAMPEEEELSFVLLINRGQEEALQEAVCVFLQFQRKVPEAVLYVIGKSDWEEGLCRAVRKEGAAGKVRMAGEGRGTEALLSFCGCLIITRALKEWADVFHKPEVMLEDGEGRTYSQESVLRQMEAYQEGRLSAPRNDEKRQTESAAMQVLGLF